MTSIIPPERLPAPSCDAFFRTSDPAHQKVGRDGSERPAVAQSAQSHAPHVLTTAQLRPPRCSAMTVIAHGAAPAAALAHAGPSPELLGGALPLLLVAAAVWALEHRQRAQGEAPGLVACGRAALRLAPELVGLALCGLAVGALLRRGENVAGAPATREDQELWAEIRGEWPVLSTADSLLGLAAVLRLLLLVSAELRGEEPRRVSACACVCASW